jgi:hypothetical protein
VTSRCVWHGSVISLGLRRFPSNPAPSCRVLPSAAALPREGEQAPAQSGGSIPVIARVNRPHDRFTARHSSCGGRFRARTGDFYGKRCRNKAFPVEMSMDRGAFDSHATAEEAFDVLTVQQRVCRLRSASGPCPAPPGSFGQYRDVAQQQMARRSQYCVRAERGDLSSCGRLWPCRPGAGPRKFHAIRPLPFCYACRPRARRGAAFCNHSPD